MPDMKQIHDFAVKWCDKFRDQNINYIELVDHWMADDCVALGFEMDCGHSFSENMDRQQTTMRLWTASLMMSQTSPCWDLQFILNGDILITGHMMEQQF